MPLLLPLLLLLPDSDMLLLPLELHMPPTGNSSTDPKVAPELPPYTWLCNPKRLLTCSLFKLCLFRRLIFSELLWFSHADPFNFDPGETRPTCLFGVAQF